MTAHYNSGIMIIYAIVGFMAWILSRFPAACVPDRFGRFYLCTIFQAVFWQSVQLVPVYCLCRLAIGVLRLPVCVYVLFIDQTSKSVIIAFCARPGIYY
nr:MAG TPA: hypothetical protein [Caudoviricetes sp.]